MSDAIHVNQCALIISLKCTLKCKLCLVYAPYYENPQNYSLSDIRQSLDMYFKLVDSCGTFNVQGGEPLMHPELPEIMEEVAKYRTKIDKILLTTNGTLLPTQRLLQVLSQYKKHIQVNISDYGPKLSKHVSELETILTEWGISFQIIHYHGDQLHFGGWLDFTDHTLKHRTEESLIANASKCGYRNGGNLAIRGNEIYFCYRVARRIELGIIKKDQSSCVDMFDARTIEEKRNNVLEILSAKYTPACAYCVGKQSRAMHYPPAIQLSREELETGVEKIDEWM